MCVCVCVCVSVLTLFVRVVVARQPCGNNTTSTTTTSIGASGTRTFTTTTATTTVTTVVDVILLVPVNAATSRICRVRIVVVAAIDTCCWTEYGTAFRVTVCMLDAVVIIGPFVFVPDDRLYHRAQRSVPYRAAIDYTIMVRVVIIKRRETMVRKNTEQNTIQHNTQMMMMTIPNTTIGLHLTTYVCLDYCCGCYCCCCCCCCFDV